MERWTSDPLAFAFAEAEFSRVSLEFEGVEHDGPTFTVLTYLNNADVADDAGRDEAANFAGAFTVFAHGDCWGDIGHCEPKREPVSAFDLRPEHPLTPANFTLDITDGVKRLVANEGVSELTVTALVTSGEDPGEDKLLRFDALTLVVFETAVPTEA
jgi:hypothetical protein